MTQYAILTVKGGASSCCEELTELGIQVKQQGVDYCIASLDSNQLALIRLRGQSVTRVLQLVTICARDQLTGVAETVKPTGSYAVRASGEERQELQEELGGIIHDTTSAKVDLEHPDTLFYVHETAGEYLFGIDLFGDLSKRHYKIITGSQSLTGPFASCTLRLAGWSPKKDLLVWPCTTGELAVEAALWASKKSPRAYELKVLDEHPMECRIVAADPKLSLVRSTEKNAKVAGVHQHIRFSRQDLDWLDTKHDESGVEYCVGVLPNLKLFPKLAKELFYQLDFILKKSGIACFVCVNEDSASAVEKHAVDYIVTRHYLWLGKHAMTLVKAQKTKTTSAS